MFELRKDAAILKCKEGCCLTILMNEWKSTAAMKITGDIKYTCFIGNLVSALTVKTREFNPLNTRVRP